MFRPEALEQQNREIANTPVQITSLRAWIWLGAFGLLTVAVLLWSVFGRLTVSLSVENVAIYPTSTTATITPDQARQIRVGMPVYAYCSPTVTGEVSRVTSTQVYVRFADSPFDGARCPIEIILDSQAPIQRLLP